MVTVPKKPTYSSSDKYKLYLADANGSMIYTSQGDLNSSFQKFFIGDYNGDGLIDLMMQESGGYYLYKSAGTSFTRSSSYFGDVIDYNGDGILEFMSHDDEGNYAVYESSGTILCSRFIPSFGNSYVVDNGMQTRILDFNGDGCTDVLTLFADGYKLYEFKTDLKHLTETYPSGTNIKHNDFLLFGDYNGDGTIDIIKQAYPFNGNWSILFLTNSGFQEQELHSFDNFSINLNNNRIYARDVNADGKDDVILVGRGQNTGNPYNRINIGISNSTTFTLTEYVSSTTMMAGGEEVERLYNFGDFNGDGRYQLFYKYISTSKLLSFASGTPGHLVSTIIDGLGVRTDLTFLPMSNNSVYARGTGATYPLMDFSSSYPLVSQVSKDNGVGGTTVVNYHYAGAKFHQKGKGFLGFLQVTATNQATGISTESHSTFDPAFFYPQLSTVHTRHGSTTLSTIANNWNEQYFGDRRIFPYVSCNEQTDNLTGLSITTYKVYDSYGNPTSVYTDFGGGRSHSTKYTYGNEKIDEWLIGRPTIIDNIYFGGAGTRTSRITRSYSSGSNSPFIDRYNPPRPAPDDSLKTKSANATPEGLNTTNDYFTNVEPRSLVLGENEWRLTRYYDSFGNMREKRVATIGLTTQTTMYNYGTNGINLLKETDPVGREISYSYDETTGLIKTRTDPFGNLTTWNYNGADQLSSVVSEGGITTTYSRSLDVTGGPSYAVYYIQEAGSDGSQTKIWYDKLERELRTETKNFGGSLVKVDKQYNAKGQLYRVSEPATGTPSQWNAIGYDDYGRMTSQDPYYGATASFSYFNSTSTKNINSHNYSLTVDAFGSVVNRTDPGGNIAYEYWADGLLKSVIAPGGATTEMNYDINNYCTSITDPTTDTITNILYPTGQLKTTTNSRRQTATITYQTDGLPDKYVTSAEGETDFTYNSDGQVSSITSPGGVSRSYTYDTRGRIGTVTESIGGVSNTVNFNYDSSGRLYRKYFNGSTDYEQYDYNPNGYLYRIQFNGTTVWQLTAMNNYGRITQASLGGTTCTWSYDAGNMLSQIAATGVQQYGYSFNANTGNLNSRTNMLKTLSESFGYDAVGLDRLTSVTGPVNLTAGYTSNNNGNIQSKSDAGSGSYAYANTPYAVSSISGALNISSTPQQIEYYSFGKVKKITEGTKTADFVYNAELQRIRMILKDNGVTTKTRWYFGSNCEREQAGGVTTQYIWIGGNAYTAVAIARKVGSDSWEVFNIFRDHLGTITHLKSGSTIYEYSFDAWGRRRDKDNWTYTLNGEPDLFADRGFTAHEFLPDFNLYNMNGRLYDPVVGRFLSPDPVIQDLGFTQNLNRYSFALNNPLRNIDPTGNYRQAVININRPSVYSRMGFSGSFVDDGIEGGYGNEIGRGFHYGGPSVEEWASRYVETAWIQLGFYYYDAQGNPIIDPGTGSSGYAWIYEAPVYNHSPIRGYDWGTSNPGLGSTPYNAATCYGRAVNGGGDWLNETWNWAKNHFYIGAEGEITYGVQLAGTLKNGLGLNISPYHQVKAEGSKSNRGKFTLNGSNKLKIMDFGAAYYVGINYNQTIDYSNSYFGKTTNTMSIGALGVFGVTLNFNDNWNFIGGYGGIDISGKAAVIWGASGSLKIGFEF